MVNLPIKPDMVSFLRNKLNDLSSRNLVFRNTLLYFLAVGLNRGMSFILLPVLTNVLNPEEYGIVSLATILIGLLKNMIGLNPSLFIIVNYYKSKKDELAGIITNIFVIIVVSSVLLFIPYFLLAKKIDYLSIQKGAFLLIIFITALLVVIESLVLSLIQMEKKGKTFCIFSLTSAFLQLIFIITFVVLLKGNWQGKLFGDLLAEIVICVILIFYLRNQYQIKWEFSLPKIKNILTFSIPLLPHSISLWGMNFIDRFFLEKMVGIESVGMYSAAYNLGLGIMLFYDALQRAWQPFFFETLEKQDIQENKKLVNYTWLYYLCCILLFFVFTLIAYLVSPVLFGEQFQSAFEFVPLIFLGYTFQGMYRIVGGHLYHLNKNWVLASITVSSLIINIFFNYVLISRNGAIGAAQSTAITFFYTFLITKIYVVKSKSMPWFYFLKPVNLKNSLRVK